jgi:hypothetical protein
LVENSLGRTSMTLAPAADWRTIPNALVRAPFVQARLTSEHASSMVRGAGSPRLYTADGRAAGRRISSLYSSQVWERLGSKSFPSRRNDLFFEQPS